MLIERTFTSRPINFVLVKIYKFIGFIQTMQNVSQTFNLVKNLQELLKIKAYKCSRIMMTSRSTIIRKNYEFCGRMKT